MKKNICFAYYADGKFIGWYADSFGSVREGSPKLYTNSEKQIDVIKRNFAYKMKKIGNSSFAEEKEKVNNLGDTISLLEYDSESLLRGKDVELRIVECPEYDGINPDFDEDEYNRLQAAQREAMKKEGIFDIPAPSKERSEAVDNFYKKNPPIKANNWIYADYNKVKEWAKDEPKTFIGKITL